MASGAFQLFGSRRRDQVSELLGDIFGRTDIEALASDWRGVVYFTLAEDESIDAETVFGFDASSGSSGELAPLDDVLAAEGWARARTHEVLPVR